MESSKLMQGKLKGTRCFMCSCRMLLVRSGREEQRERQQQLEPQRPVPALSEWQRDTGPLWQPVAGHAFTLLP
jgi:hypothetical protein